MRRHAGLVLAFAVLGCPLPPLHAQSGSVSGTISTDAGIPLVGASVTVDGTGLRASSGPAGAYVLRGVPRGTHTVRVRFIGYTGTSARVTVAPGAGAVQDFALTRAAVQLAPINVVLGSRARHTAAQELAVPVDIYPAEVMQQQGSTETSQILQS